MRRLARHNDWSCDALLLYIDGKVIRGHNLRNMLEDYLSANGLMQDFCLDFVDCNPNIANLFKNEQDLQQQVELADRSGKFPRCIGKQLDYIDMSYGINSSYSMALGYEAHKGFYIATQSLNNCTIDEVSSAFQSLKPGYIIYDDDSCGIVSEDPKDYKIIQAYSYDVDSWIMIIDHKAYFGDSYFEAFENYLDENGIVSKYNKYCMETFADSVPNKESFIKRAQTYIDLDIPLPDMEEFLDDDRIANGKSMVFAKEIKNMIFLDTTKLFNTTQEEAVKELQWNLPSMNICDMTNGEVLAKQDNAVQDDEVIQKVAKMFNIENRNSAITYINGEVISGNNHFDNINKWMRQHKLASNSVPTLHGYSLVFINKVGHNLYIENNTSVKSDLNDVKDKLKQLYNNCSIRKENIV